MNPRLLFASPLAKVQITFFLFVSIIPLYSQNLVPNWSFEQYYHCPTTYTQIGYAIGWHPSYVNTCCNYQVEYLNACGSPGFQVPSSVWGYKYASTGVADMAQVTMAPSASVNYRENIYTKLISPLVVGQLYYVSMRACHTTYSQTATNNDGIRFSTDTTFAVDNITAVHSTSVISDTANWTTISGCYTADSAYTYIGVGNFFDDAHTTITTSCHSCSNPYPGYFIDDISVVPIGVSGNRFICPGDTDRLTASGGASYLWNNGNTTSSILVNPDSTTTYSVKVTNPTCNYTFSITVTADTIPQLSISGPQTICPGGSTTLNATGADDYSWSPSTGLNNATIASPIASPSVTTTYTVTGTGCKGKGIDSVLVTIRSCDSVYVYIPNVFTPNNDGTNDLFVVTAEGINNYHIEIFNRWGEKLFESNNTNIAWNGRNFSGIMQSDGIYYYIITGTYPDGNSLKKDGFLQLLK